MADRMKNKDKRLYIIYCLVDPRDLSVFYVGCTCDTTLKKTYYRHLYESCTFWAGKEGVYYRKKWKMKSIYFAGYQPLIMALAVVQHDLSGICERLYYEHFIKRGHDLIQNPDQLIYERQY